MAIGYKRLVDLLARREDIRVSAEDSVLDSVFIPEETVARTFIDGLEPALRLLAGTRFVAEASGFGLYVGGTEPSKEDPDWHVEVRFSPMASTESDDQPAEPFAASLAEFSRQQPPQTSDQGTLLLRFYRGDRRPLSLFHIVSGWLGEDSRLRLAYAGLMPQRWSFLAIGLDEENQQPNDLILPGHYIKDRSAIYLSALQSALLSRRWPVRDLAESIGLRIGLFQCAFTLAYSPRFKRHELEEFGIPIHNQIGDAELPPDYPVQNDSGEAGGISPVSSVVDILGVYHPDIKQVILFPRMIAVYAASLGLPMISLEKVVEIHEIAHAISHLAIDLDGNAWDRFGQSTNEIREAIAQVLTRRMVRGSADLERAFLALEEHQPAVYRAWRKLDELSNEGLREYVLRARK